MDAAAVTSGGSVVTLHLTDGWVWAHRGVGSWDGPTAVVADAAGVRYAEQPGELATDNVERGVLRHVDCSSVSIGGSTVDFADLVTLNTEHALSRLGASAGPTDLVLTTHPTHWGRPRIDRFVAALHRIANDVSPTPTAVAAARAADDLVGGRDGAPRSRVVIEIGEFGTTVSVVVAQQDGHHVHTSELAPTLWGTGGDGDRLAAVVDGVLAGRAAGELVIAVDPTVDAAGVLDGLRNAMPEGQRMVLIEGEQLVRALEPAQVDAPAEVTRLPPAGWLDGAVRRSEQAPARRGLPKIGLLAGAALAVVAVAIAAAVALRTDFTPAEWSDTPAAHSTAAPRTPATAAVVAPSSTADPSTPSGALRVGRVTLDVPAGWAEQSPSLANRVELRPIDGSQRRMIMTQNPINDGAGYDEVYATLASKIAARAQPDKFGDLERDVVFGGRPGLSYREAPDAKSEVEWHVIVDHGLQVSVGCQVATGQWDTIADECDRLIRNLVVGT